MIAETEQPDIALQLRVIVGVTGSDQIIISGGALAAGTGHIQTSSRISGPGSTFVPLADKPQTTQKCLVT